MNRGGWVSVGMGKQSGELKMIKTFYKTQNSQRTKTKPTKSYTVTQCIIQQHNT